MSPRTQEELDIEAIEKFLRFRMCPACRVSQMMHQVNRDAMQCPDATCGFVVTGKESRQGVAAVFAALESHRQREQRRQEGMMTDNKLPPRTIASGYYGHESERDVMQKTDRMYSSVFERIEKLEERVRNMQRTQMPSDAR